MKIIQTKAQVNNGCLILPELLDKLPKVAENVDVVIVINDHEPQKDFEQARLAMQQSFKEAEIETNEQIFNLIKDVKCELFKERKLT